MSFDFDHEEALQMQIELRNQEDKVISLEDENLRLNVELAEYKVVVDAALHLDLCNYSKLQHGRATVEEVALNKALKTLFWSRLPKPELDLTVPKVGEDIYVGSRFYVSHAADDFVGGLAKVKKVTEGISGGKPCVWIEIEEQPGAQWNWDFLGKEQEELQTKFGNNRAHSDPELNPELNTNNL